MTHIDICEIHPISVTLKYVDLVTFNAVSILCRKLTRRCLFTVQQQRVLPPVQGHQSDSAGTTTPPDCRRLRDPARTKRANTGTTAQVRCDGLQSRNKRLISSHTRRRCGHGENVAAGHGESNVYSMYIAARFSQFKVAFYMVQLLELAQFMLGTPGYKALVLYFHNKTDLIEFTFALGNIWRLLHMKTVTFILVPSNGLE